MKYISLSSRMTTTCVVSLVSLVMLFCVTKATAGDRYNFNAGWRLALGEHADGSSLTINDSEWKQVTLPYAFNQAEAYSRNCAQLSDTVMWYRKHFVLPPHARGKKIFVEFEGVRFAARAFLNGHELGWHENGVMAFGFDLTPYVNYSGENVLAVYVDNDWKYREQTPSIGGEGKLVRSQFQWNDKNFYCNYGGINKNVWLHVMDNVYQTLPLYSNLGTTGVYVYAKDIDVKRRTATIHVEAQVINSTHAPATVEHSFTLTDAQGHEVASFKGMRCTIAPGDTVTLHSKGRIAKLHLWSWGYGYLYDVKSAIRTLGPVVSTDTQTIRTGFRQTAFADGMFRLNNRVLQLKGFAQRSTNEWPALGISIPPSMSDYSNSLILGCNGNFIRWMHVTPSKQDVESCDRLGIIQAMPAGDSEKDVNDRRWQHRCALMRDAIIYHRNSPSVVFYEGGNNNISDEHMAQLIAIRDKYDPHGGRAAGSRNMLDSRNAEYGGEMLYVNKSASKPMIMMEYNRDEGIRRYWDQWSYPYHKEGEGPLYRGSHTASYNHNQDGLAIENIVRWNEYWMARPGTGKRVNSGGAKIIFSDSNTHARGEKSYRTSGDVDAMRIPKDSYFAHRVMWNGWVDTEEEGTHIIGHWNYDSIPSQEEAVVKPVYVCSTGDEVELFVNGRSLGKGRRSHTFLFTFDSVRFEPGTLRAVSYKDGRCVSSDARHTVSAPVALRMRWIGGAPSEALADGSDIRIAEIEAVDNQGRRHPLAHNMIHFEVSGEGTYIGGVSGVVSEEEKQRNAAAQPAGHEGIVAEGGQSTDTNGVDSDSLMLEAGVVRVMVRTTTLPGTVTLTAFSTSLGKASASITTKPCPTQDGFYVDAKGCPIEADRSRVLPLHLQRGATPSTPSFTHKLRTVNVGRFEAAVNTDNLRFLNDDIEDGVTNTIHSKWSSDGNLANAWLRVHLERPAAIAQIAIRMDNFRTTSYPLQVYAIMADGERQLVWEGYTAKCLGDNYLDIAHPVTASTYEIRMVGEATVKEAFASMTELAARKNVSTAASKSNTLSISEISFNEKW